MIKIYTYKIFGRQWGTLELRDKQGNFINGFVADAKDNRTLIDTLFALALKSQLN